MTPQKPPAVYYVVGGPNIDYMYVFGVSLQSLRRHNPDLHVICICDARFAGAVQAVADDHMTCVVTKVPLDTCVAASMHKLSIFEEVPDLCDRHGTLLYLDCDIVVLGSLLPLLEASFGQDVLCVATEDKSLLSTYYANDDCYSYEDLAMMEAHGIRRPFNAGQFMLHANKSMHMHFVAIQNSILSHNNSSFYYEQSFMNPYFNMQPSLRNDTLLGNVTRLHPARDVPDKECLKGILLVHFYGAHFPLTQKLRLMFTTYLQTA
jgi:hypothetical protein